MLLLRLATRNLFRQVSRNALSMVSIVMGVFIMVIGQGFIGGLTENIVRAQIDTASGHVMILPPDYPSTGLRHPIDDLIAPDQATLDWLDQNAEAWTGRVILVPRAIAGRDASRVRLVGYDPATDEAVFPRTEWQIEGALPDGTPDGALISKGVAKLLQLEVGDSFVMEARTADGAINALRVTATGILTTNSPMIDLLGVFAPRALVDQLALSEGRNSHLAMRLDHRDDATDAAAELRSLLGESAMVRTWLQESQAMLDVQELRQNMLNMMGFALLAMAAAGIANTVLMAAFERVREIGTLRALGMNRGGIIGMFCFEGLWMGLVGGALGAVAAGAINRHYAQAGIDMAQMMQGQEDAMGNIPFSSMLYMDYSPEVAVGAVLVAAVVAVLASLYPAVLASRLVPAEAVRAQ